MTADTASPRLVAAEADRGKIKTHFVYPPVPLRCFDWIATFADDEPNDNGQMLHGYGATEEEAIEELLTNYEDGL